MFKLAGVILSHVCGFPGTAHTYERKKKDFQSLTMKAIFISLEVS